MRIETPRRHIHPMSRKRSPSNTLTLNGYSVLWNQTSIPYPKIPKVLSHAFSLVPECYRRQSVIVGGAAACLELAPDIDIFVLQRAGALVSLDQHTAAIRRQIRLSALQSSLWKLTFSPYPKANRRIVANYGQGILPYPIQLIAVPDQSIFDLLSSCDISTHMVAIDYEGCRHVIPQTTPLNEHPAIHRFNAQTVDRYRKICPRYGHTPDENYVNAQRKILTDT